MTSLMWGTAASATQTEGAHPASDWYAWEQAGRAPHSGRGNGFGDRYADDFALLASWGLHHHRLSLDWSRLEPAPGRHDPAAVEHYRAVLSAGRDAGLSIWVTLLHGALPNWFTAAGGILADDAAPIWARHVDFVADTFADLVHGWKPVNGPTSLAVKRYLAGQAPPGHRDRAEFAGALRAIHAADLAAARRLRETGRPVSSVQALVPLLPADDSPAAAAATRQLDQAVWGSWLPHARDAYDYVGFSYYYAARVDAAGQLLPYPADGELGPQGHVPWAGGLRLVLDRLAAELPGKPLLIAELGCGGADEVRARYLREAVDVIRGAIDDGIDVAGAFLWTGVDNYEWQDGYDVPYGLFDRERKPRHSAHLIRDIVATW